MDEIKEQIKNAKNLVLLGKGQFGEVYKLEYQGKVYAIKKLSKKKIDNNVDVGLRTYLKNALKREIDILKRMSQYENSVKFYGHFEEENEYVLVLEFCDTDLEKYLQKGPLSNSEILAIMEGLNKPFKYMHNNGLLHRDIKPENIMIKYLDSSKTKYIAKIADYGISRELDDGKASTILGTPKYMSPEILLGEDEYTDKSDLFSIGVMLYYLYFKSYPFKTPKKYKEITEFYKEKKEKDCKDTVLDDLINKLLTFEADKRISWDEYFKHPFFSNKVDKVDDLTNKLDNMKIDNEKEHQVINLYDYTLEKIIDFTKIITKAPGQYISIDECLNLKDEPFFILGILGKYLEQIGINVSIERNDIKRNDYLRDYHKNIFQLICNSYILKSKYLLDFNLGENRLKNLVKNPIERCNFNEKLKNIIMKIYNLKEEELLITNHRREKGIFTAVIAIKSNFNKKITKDEIIGYDKIDEEIKTLTKVEKELITPSIKLSKSMLNPKEDNKKNQWARGEKKGGEDYIPPDGWIKYGINIDHGFNDRNNEWINYLHLKGEWCAAYCGITGINKKIEQIYENDDDIRHQGKKVGVGVYCPSDPEIMEEYTETIYANGANYKVGFMLRVKPDKIRASQKNEKIWVVNGNDNELRPYGILIKQV